MNFILDKILIKLPKPVMTGYVYLLRMRSVFCACAADKHNTVASLNLPQKPLLDLISTYKKKRRRIRLRFWFITRIWMANVSDDGLFAKLE